MIAAAQGSDALLGPQKVHMLCTFQLPQVDLPGVAVGLGADGKARGDLGADELVQLLQLHMLVLEDDGLHAASDVHAHQIGTDLVPDGHGGAHGAACTGVDVGHHAHPATLRIGLIEEADDLGDGFLVNGFGKDLGLRVFSS